MMPWRMTTLNLEQNHKRWDVRRELVIDQLVALQPDVVALNEICLSLQTGRWLQRAARERLGVPFALVQQSKVNGSSLIDGEALLTRYSVVETANWDYRTLDAVAQVVRLDIEGRLLDVYVTHLYRSRGDDALRLYQVQQLLAWIQTRDDVEAQVVCGDFNATLEMPSAQLMASVFRPTQTAPTAYTPCKTLMAACPIRIGPGLIGVSIISGWRDPWPSMPAGCVSTPPVPPTRHCGPPTMRESGPILPLSRGAHKPRSRDGVIGRHLQSPTA